MQHKLTVAMNDTNNSDNVYDTTVLVVFTTNINRKDNVHD